MDVLSPDLVWIENRCYRVNPTTDDSSEYQSDPCYIEPDFDSEEEVQMDFAIEKTKEGSFRTSFHVPSCFHGSIIGQKGATRKRLEMDTKCLIQVPSRGSKQPIVVTAQREEDAIAARKKIEDIVFSSRRRQDITHFPSLPCCQDSVVESFAKFKNSILSGSPPAGLTESMFQKPEKLHVTLVVLTLMDEEERKLAKEVLQQEADKIRGILQELSTPAEVKIQGIEIMNDDRTATKILYAKIDCTVLEIIVEYLAGAYAKTKLSPRTRDRVKLHMTLIDTKFDSGDQDGHQGRQPFPTFDSTDILQQFRDFHFGTIPLTEIHLSQRNAYDDKGYYKATTVLNF